jgi:hypothetical protein
MRRQVGACTRGGDNNSLRPLLLLDTSFRDVGVAQYIPEVKRRCLVTKLLKTPETPQSEDNHRPRQV